VARWRREVVDRCDAWSERVAIDERDQICGRLVWKPDNISVVEDRVFDRRPADEDVTLDRDHVVRTGDRFQARVRLRDPRMLDHDVGGRRAADRHRSSVQRDDSRLRTVLELEACLRLQRERTG
jgi:hypothetical protein